MISKREFNIVHCLIEILTESRNIVIGMVVVEKVLVTPKFKRMGVAKAAKESLNLFNCFILFIIFH